jgi:hypothetical protein
MADCATSEEEAELPPVSLLRGELSLQTMVTRQFLWQSRLRVASHGEVLHTLSSFFESVRICAHLAVAELLR